MTVVTHLPVQVKDKVRVFPTCAIKACRGNIGIAPVILQLGARWRGMVSLMHWPLFPQGAVPHYPMNRYDWLYSREFT